MAINFVLKIVLSPQDPRHSGEFPKKNTYHRSFSFSFISYMQISKCGRLRLKCWIFVVINTKRSNKIYLNRWFYRIYISLCRTWQIIDTRPNQRIDERNDLEYRTKDIQIRQMADGNTKQLASIPLYRGISFVCVSFR